MEGSPEPQTKSISSLVSENICCNKAVLMFGFAAGLAIVFVVEDIIQSPVRVRVRMRVRVWSLVWSFCF